jgi:small subunit ribosomal protein S17
MENKRKSKQGLVMRKSGDKSIVVRVERMVQHPVVKKYVRRHSHFHVHDPKNECLIGDEVVIRECRPLSKNKRWLFETLTKRIDGAAENG